jgi:DNA-binding GntR family transcriptional regulator
MESDMPSAVLETGGSGPLQTLTDRVYEQLAKAIVTGELAPGTKLNQPELARRFGTSRGPLREAIERLEARRLVIRTANLGAKVVTLSRDVLIEMFMVREALEGLAARLAAERMEDHEIAALEKLLDDHATYLRREVGYDTGDYDGDFHYRLVIGSRNEMIKEVLCGDLYQLVKLYRVQNRFSQSRAKRALIEHRRIVEALKDRDGEMAEFMMRRHISTATSILQSSILRHDKELPDMN